MLKISPRPTRRTRAKHETKKPSIEERLLAATERLLAQGQSFGSLTVAQLTKEASMARATFYLHFQDKGELVARLIDQLTQEMILSFGTWTRNADVADRKDVQVAVAGMIKTFKRHQAIISAVRDTMANDENVAKLYVKMGDTIASLAKTSIMAVTKRGSGRKEAGTDVADALTWSIVLWCTHFIDQSDDKELKKAIDVFSVICNSTIFSDDASSQPN